LARINTDYFITFLPQVLTDLDGIKNNSLKKDGKVDQDKFSENFKKYFNENFVKK